jgi:hypothetical protein
MNEVLQLQPWTVEVGELSKKTIQQNQTNFLILKSNV